MILSDNPFTSEERDSNNRANKKVFLLIDTNINKSVILLARFKDMKTTLMSQFYFFVLETNKVEINTIYTTIKYGNWRINLIRDVQDLYIKSHNKCQAGEKSVVVMN